MADEPPLGRQHAEIHRDPERHPRIPQCEENRPSGAKGDKGQRDLGCVIATPAIEEPSLSNLRRQCPKVGSRRRSRGDRLHKFSCPDSAEGYPTLRWTEG